MLNGLNVVMADDTNLDLYLGIMPNFNLSMSGDNARFTKSYDKDDKNNSRH